MLVLKLYSGLCRDKPIYPLSREAIAPQVKGIVALVTDERGDGVAIIDPQGDIKRLPSKVPSRIVEDALPVLPVVEPVSSGDRDELLRQIREGVQLKPVPRTDDVIEIVEKPIDVATETEQETLISELKRGVTLKKVGEARCGQGYYWSMRLGGCVAISGYKSQREQLLDELMANVTKFKERESQEEEGEWEA